MRTKLVDALDLETHPVALMWTDTVPEGALQFKPGRWGCVMSLFATVAMKGRVGAFDRDTYGCWGGGVGLGFGNCYETFPGGIDGFCGFLADGNESSEQGRRMGEQVAQWDRRLANDFLHGERYLKSSDVTRRFLDGLPMCDIHAQYVVLKPLGLADSDNDDIKSITFFVDPEQLSALVILANYLEPQLENVSVPWAAACQVIGIFAYRELQREHPRALIGLTDISARLNTRASLGSNVHSFTVPWPLFLQMEQNVDGSFFQSRTWHELRSPDGGSTHKKS
ncbi:MAG TPA: DUF169 domain-containing protein [Terriglobales bacterium]|nr:DUF169 domain-containing protein [Terriglobales bacterium]